MHGESLELIRKECDDVVGKKKRGRDRERERYSSPENEPSQTLPVVSPCFPLLWFPLMHLFPVRGGGGPDN